MGMQNFEYYQKMFQEKKLYGNDAAMFLARDFFSPYYAKFKDDEEWRRFINSLGAVQAEKMFDLIWFYYHLVQPYNETGSMREELRLVAITSTIEQLMSDQEFKDFLQWYRGKYHTNTITDLTKMEQEYLNEFGAAKKVRTFFEAYFTPDEKDDLMEYIKPIPDIVGTAKPRDIHQVAKFFYDMRSEFVHSAKMGSFCPSEAVLAGVVVKGKAYTVTLEIQEFMAVFEKAFIRFWLRKAGYDDTFLE